MPPVRCSHCGCLIQEAEPARIEPAEATCLRCCEKLGLPVDRMLGAIKRNRMELDEKPRNDEDDGA